LRRIRGGVFDIQISNQIVVAAVGPGGGTAEVVRTVLAFGTRVGGLTDPNGTTTARAPTYTRPAAASRRAAST
jgi:hypothetical protein